ncbi:hypothetical protein PC121_g8488 [Phytophthora cactorum]|nr:hypothetical protein PC120_g4040 [Phytophthora cactorum]KAG3073936.1 hypothetical protein PC121_g8488 [Phytophthora cactorum]KAG3090010.1 hypothetical protein PC122_g7636 [Phytophthora cactorum]
MAFVAKLQDVEQQLLRATQVVQLHVRLADTGPAELEEAEEKGIVGFIESVERAQRGLENIMTQLLVLAKCRVSKSSREEEVDEKTARVEMRRRLALKSSMSTNRMRRMMKLSIMSSRKDDPENCRSEWVGRQPRVLDLLSDGKVEEDVALAFLRATTFAVSVLTSYQSVSQKPSWLMQLVEDLTDVENAAKDSAVAEVLAPVKKCRDDLVEYCSLDNCDALEDMSNYVILIERHRGVQADHLLPYLLTLLRKFICDCTDYQLRQDVVGEAPRTDSEWIRFSDIGNKLANWMQVLWRAEVKCSKVDALLVSSYFREFETRFPGTLPAVLHESWCQITGDAGNKILDNYEASLESQHQARTDNQQMVSDSSVNSAPNAAPTGVMIPVSDGPKPLEKFISATKEAQIEFEKVMIDRTSDSGLKKDRELTIAKWSDVLKNCFGQACMDLCTRLSRGDLHEQLATAFCEATKFTVSLITVYESRSFPHSWITATIMILDATLEEATRSEFSQELEPLIQSRNELLRYCDRHYPNWFDGVEDSLTGIERGVSKIAASKELRAAVLKLGEKFRSICTYMMLRQKIGVTLEWPEDSWRKFNDVGLVLSHWLQRVGKSLAGWAQVMSQELLKFSLMFPGRVPKPLLKSDNMRKHFAAATARLKRTKTSAYSEISDSGTVVSGVKRARIDPDIIDYPTKRSATAGMDLKLGGDATIHATKVKIIAHLQMGTAIGHIFAICEVLNSKAAKRIQNYLDQTREVNAQVLDLLGQGMDSNSRQTFDRATEILTDVIW